MNSNRAFTSQQVVMTARNSLAAQEENTNDLC